MRRRKPSRKSNRRKSLLRRFVARTVRWCVAVSILLVLLTVIQVAALRVVDPPVTVCMATGWAWGVVRGEPYKKPAYYWQDGKDISIFLKRAVLAAEDQRFLQHSGFDFTEMGIALKDLFANRKVRGASTITMQTARTVFLWPSRTVSRKLAEAYYTAWMELLLPKERILELYLNTVDWGDGIMGAEAAARKYFQTGADRLTRDQAVRLASILPNPHRWSPTKSSDYLRHRRWRIRRDMDKMYIPK